VSALRLSLRLALLASSVAAAGAVPPGARAQENGIPPSLTPASARVDSLILVGLPLTAARVANAELAGAGPDAAPATVLAAARAQAAAGAWVQVARLLVSRPWLDDLAGGEGRLLDGLARLETGDAAGALASLDSVLPGLLARGEAASGLRRSGPRDVLDGSAIAAPAPGDDPVLAGLTGRARALSRLGRDAEAAEAWLEAARLRPAIGPWLRLSALQALGRAGRPDAALEAARSVARARALPRDSVWIEVARAAFVAGDSARGLAFSDSLSASTAAGLAGRWLIPFRLARGDTAAARRLARRALESRRGDASVGETWLALDTTLAGLRLVAGADLASGRTARATELLARALARAPAADRPALRLELAEAWFARTRYAETRATLAPWLRGAEPAEELGPERLRAQALFLAGRAWYRQGSWDEAIALWRRVSAMPAAPDGAQAAFLIADIHHDRGNLEAASEAYERTVERYPRSGYAGTALFRLGMLDLLAERPERAVERFETYRRRSPGGNWYHASIYWTARSKRAAGDSASAKALYREALGYDPLSYYGILSAQALGLDAWEHVPRRDGPPAPPPRPVDLALVERLDLLRFLGWRGRAVRELSARDRTGETPAVRLALGLLLNAHGWTWQGTSLADAARRSGTGAWTDDMLRGVYPLVYANALREAAGRQRLEPALVAAIVRRESQFDREVASPANAIGLMQILPRTGAELARRSGLSEFDPDQLRVAEVNLRLGTLYLRELLDRNGGALAPALISYNAGPHRFARWREFPEFSSDAELLVERIPFTETRIYVKTITAYRHIYRRLWGLDAASVDAPPADR
jgi:tetratricopeptide (TPR) repeat protein